MALLSQALKNWAIRTGISWFEALQEPFRRIPALNIEQAVEVELIQKEQCTEVNSKSKETGHQSYKPSIMGEWMSKE